jgi:hypothetical protein
MRSAAPLTPETTDLNNKAVCAMRRSRWILGARNLRRYVAGGKMRNVVDLARGFQL